MHYIGTFYSVDYCNILSNTLHEIFYVKKIELDLKTINQNMHYIGTFYSVDYYNILSNTLHEIFSCQKKKKELDFQIFMFTNFGYVLSVNISFKLIYFIFNPTATKDL